MPDRYGELHPIINQSLCVDCGLCKQICPANHEIDAFSATDCYAAWVGKISERTLSASGGIAALMYKHIIEKCKGVAYGVTWNEKIEPHFTRMDNMSEVDNFKGSKYVQAFVDNSYRSVKSDLLKDKWVLFIGTPCQIAGLRSFLHRDYEKLLTCDLLCHGVPPYDYLKQELSSITHVDMSVVQNCRFRGNDRYNYWLTLWDKDRKMLYAKRGIQSPYLLGFLVSLTLRESCYKCPYASKYRVADITIGDFIGLKEMRNPIDKLQNPSVCVPITPKGMTFWKSLCESYPDLHYEKYPYEVAVSYGPSFRHPAMRNVKRDKFLNNYQKMGWNYAIRRALWKSILRNIILSKIKK